MKSIELDSVGSLVTEDGIVSPMSSEAINTGLDGEGVHIMDCVDEWWESMECEEAVRLFQFFSKTKMYLKEDYFKWASDMMKIVVESKGFVDITAARLHEGWSI